MNSLKIVILLFLILGFFPSLLWSQVKIGQWVDHTSYRTANSVAKLGTKVYTSNGKGLSVFDESDNELSKLSKIEGLSDIGVNLLRKNSYNDLLFVFYNNTNIDVINTNGDITNVADIKRKVITGKKTINEVFFDGKYAYLACGFGIIVFDTERLEVKDTYYIGTNVLNYEVYQVTKNDTAFFAATEKGVYYGKIGDNLSYYLNWKSLTNNIPVGPYNTIVNFNGKIITNYSEKLKSGANHKDTLYELTPIGWTGYSLFAIPPGSVTYKMNVSNGRLYLIDSYKFLAEFNTSAQRTMYIAHYNFADAHVNDWYFDGSAYWIADNNYGLIKTAGPYTYENAMVLNGPENNLVNDFDIREGVLAVAPIFLGETFDSQYKYYRPQLYKDKEWTTFPYSQLDTIRDINSVSIDPNDKDHFVFACMDYGITELVGGQYYNYNLSNSPLATSVYTLEGLRATSVLIDNNSNVWAGLTYGKNIINVKKAGSSNWVGLNFESIITKPTVSKMIVDKSNQLWVVLARNTGLMVYRDVASLSTPNSSNTKLLSTAVGNGHLPTTEVKSICEDNDGKIWLGTAEGILVFYNPENVFSGGNWDGQQILIEQDGHVQILLENDVITAIAVDGINRKWVGTESSGVYCFSSDGQQTIYHFTADNSPLYSDNIIDIAINETTGDVFFGTDMGIQSYRTSIIKGFEEYTKVHAYPNPVKPGYVGNIVVTGLIDESQVKIVDMAGNLVWSTKSQGGQIEWNLKTFSGTKAATGAYMIYCFNGDGTQYATTKLLIVN